MQADKPCIALDCDGVILHYEEELFLIWCRDELGWNIDVEMFRKTHQWYEATGGKANADIAPQFVRFLRENEHVQEVIEGARTGLLELYRHFDIVMVTARREDLDSVTMQQLKRERIDHVFSTIIWGAREEKGVVVQEFGARAVVDDCISELRAVLDMDIDTTIIQFPSFRGAQQPGIDDPRVHRLDACNRVHEGVDTLARPQLWKSAWQELVEVLCSSPTAVS